MLPPRRLVSLLLPALAACSLGQPPALPALYELGAPPPRSAAAAVELQLLDIDAPSWMNGSGIAYRLDYLDRYRREFYRDSRWVAPPAALLAERLRQRAASPTAAARQPLRLELEDCVQVFASPTQSELRLSVRAWLGEGAGARFRRFEIGRPAAPNAAGAVAGLAAAADELFEGLQAWAAER
ncbi:ABC-type transport auxiliary lipoprotein family protein [Roseateles violae]|uniref:ABC-type transport auxiliary lipoprotein family protein n=1 Tax=Roseateles violae TaxID=3058042 RepID=A0ABT8DZD8_9BURK|nr:ABC-type transport auxiliary lipoprotein family protein [Pelomonas sp. PFR6]MDN3922966.1 ABC-type transport auxiliary lipoprotein family protein [Pelomonas sp. PFR6]